MCNCSVEEYVKNCPLIEDRTCPEKEIMDWITADRPWFQPGVPAIVFGGFMRTCQLHFRLDDWDTPEKAKAIMEDLREKYHLDDYLVFKTCPKCGWELPAMDFNVGGECVLCSQKESQSSGGTE